MTKSVVKSLANFQKWQSMRIFLRDFLELVFSSLIFLVPFISLCNFDGALCWFICELFFLDFYSLLLSLLNSRGIFIVFSDNLFLFYHLSFYILSREGIRRNFDSRKYFHELFKNQFLPLLKTF